MLYLGDQFPNFTANTTDGEINFHNYLGADFTPVCTTELSRVLILLPGFSKRNTKVIGLSCDTVTSHVV
ncbi:hypothetical protein O3G_MSEX002041 [Manduca sexta]|uniref:Alkyl hydroperoxide reductase subunit C/ Thiol specific antioxidant domain-containing protein n=1 Tax=Manduca sexta TaxID=7130 RepID=A0A921YLY2_MANSE|nr:hypothetical protein O3G_MSEX002041 [Manduca sexta]